MFDKEVLNDLKDLLEDDFGHLITAYVRDLSTKMPLIVSSLENGDVSQVQSLSHSLKGASKNIGVSMFAESCSQIEQLAKQSNTEELKRLVPEAEKQAADLTEKLTELYLT